MIQVHFLVQSPDVSLAQIPEVIPILPYEFSHLLDDCFINYDSSMGGRPHQLFVLGYLFRACGDIDCRTDKCQFLAPGILILQKMIASDVSDPGRTPRANTDTYLELSQACRKAFIRFNVFDLALNTKN